MAKDSFYFSHDSNARNDDKIIAMRMSLGWEGYGLFWALIEKLRESKDYMCICDYNVIAYDLRVDSKIIKKIIEDFGLFVFTENGKHFYSESLLNRMSIKAQRSAKARESANKRWNDANAMQTQCEGNAKKERKEKESKYISQSSTREENFYTLTSIENLLEKILKQEEGWIMPVAKNFKKTVAEVKNELKQFANELILKGNELKSEQDFKNHFINLLNIRNKEKNSAKKESYAENKQSTRRIPSAADFDNDN